MRSARSDGANVRALRALDAIVGKREGRGAKVNLAPRAGKITFARDDSLKLDIAGLLSTLEASEAAIPVDEGVEHTSTSEITKDAESMRENKRAKLSHNVRENQQQSENADALATSDASADNNLQLDKGSMLVHANQSESEPRGCENIVSESSCASETERAAPYLENDGFDPELDAKLKLVAQEMMREVLEECENRDRARCKRKECAKADSGSLACSGENREEKIENEQVNKSDIAGMRADNRYYLTVVLGGHEYKALFDPGATLSFAGPRVTEALKDRLKEYESVIRSVNGKVTPVLGIFDLILEVDGEPRIISVNSRGRVGSQSNFRHGFLQGV